MRLTLACAAAVLLAGPAVADPTPSDYPVQGRPVTWSYRAEVQYDQDYGDDFVVTVHPGQTVRTAAGDMTGYWLFNSVANPRPAPGEYEVRYGFALKATITDEASGESAAFWFRGSYASMWMYPDSERDNPDRWRWEFEGSEFGDFRDTHTAHLGGVEYRVRAYGGGTGQTPNGELVVQAVATPEPGTLALAGLGLGVGALRAVRRRG